MGHRHAAHVTRTSIVTLGGAFMVSRYLAAEEARLGLPELGEIASSAEAADLLYRVVDDADLTGLALASGWREQTRPQHPSERVAHALMLAREVRGGLHFAALRACGLGVPEAAVADPHTGRDRLLRTGWAPDDADAPHRPRRGEARPACAVAPRRAADRRGVRRAVAGPGARGDGRLVDLLTALPLPAR